VFKSAPTFLKPRRVSVACKTYFTTVLWTEFLYCSFLTPRALPCIEGCRVSEWKSCSFSSYFVSFEAVSCVSRAVLSDAIVDLQVWLPSVVQTSLQHDYVCFWPLTKAVLRATDSESVVADGPVEMALVMSDPFSERAVTTTIYSARPTGAVSPRLPVSVKRSDSIAKCSALVII
jgi:hypothetical protein